MSRRDLLRTASAIRMALEQLEEDDGNSRESIADMLEEMTSEHEPKNEPYQMTYHDLTTAPLQPQDSSADDPAFNFVTIETQFCVCFGVLVHPNF